MKDDYDTKPTHLTTRREEVNRLIDSILQLTAEMNALDAKRNALRAKLLATCCPGST